MKWLIFALRVFALIFTSTNHQKNSNNLRQAYQKQKSCYGKALLISHLTTFVLDYYIWISAIRVLAYDYDTFV